MVDDCRLGSPQRRQGRREKTDKIIKKDLGPFSWESYSIGDYKRRHQPWRVITTYLSAGIRSNAFVRFYLYGSKLVAPGTCPIFQLTSGILKVIITLSKVQGSKVRKGNLVSI